MVLLSWNVAGRVSRLVEQAELVTSAAADVVCLQELTPKTAPRWRAVLEDAGYAVAVAELPAVRDSSRPLGVLIASRSPDLEGVAVADVPWPERVLAARIGGELEVVNVHSPISPKPGLAKVLTHEAAFRHLASGSGPRLVCGDLNTPRREHADGTVWTFARTRNGVLRPERGERWDAAETALIRGLAGWGFRDAFREIHGHVVKEPSWTWPRGGGYRLDHLIVSAEIAVRDCGYLHEWRTELKLSDHSPLRAELGIAR